MPYIDAYALMPDTPFFTLLLITRDMLPLSPPLERLMFFFDTFRLRYATPCYFALRRAFCHVVSI